MRARPGFLIVLVAVAACNSLLGIEEVDPLPGGDPDAAVDAVDGGGGATDSAVSTDSAASADGAIAIDGAPPPDAALPIALGWPSTFPNSISNAADQLNLFPLHLDQQYEVVGFGITTQTATGNVLMGVYADDGGAPGRPTGSPLAFGDVALTAVGTNDNTNILSATIGPGDYWLGFLPAQQTSMRESDLGADILENCSVSREYDFGLPNVSTTNCNGTFAVNIIMYVAVP